MNKFLILGFSLSIAGSQAQTTLKDSLSIEEIVINENRFNTPISRLNRNVYALSREQIKHLPVKTLQEALQYANGIDLKQRGPFGTQADISIDGGSFEQTVILLNGVKIIDAQTAHNMLNLPIPIEIIERIEIVRGPAARVYGVNSLTGAINIVTRNPKKSGVFANTYIGSNFEKDNEKTEETFWNRGIHIGGSLNEQHHRHTITASHNQSNGYRYNTEYENNKVFYQGDIELSPTDELKAWFGYVNNRFGANGFYASPGDKNSFEIVQTTMAALQSKHSLSEKWTLTPRLSYRYNYDDYRYLGKFELDIARSQHYTNSFSGELHSVYQSAVGDFGFGAEFRDEDINSSNIGTHDRNNLGFFAEYRTNFLEKLFINLGAYANYNSDYGWQIYPGIDARYQLAEQLFVVGNLGSSQRIPSFTDLYLTQTGNIGNPEVRPENAFQSEIGLKYQFGTWNLDINYFYRTIDHFIDWVRIEDTHPWQSQNFGDLTTHGINGRISYKTSFENTSLITALGYSYLDSQFRNTDPTYASKYVIASLRHQITHTLSYHFKNVSVLLATRFNERASSKSYIINDMRIGYKLKYFNVFADAQNLLNTSYTEVGAVPLPGRWLSLGLQYTSF